ncbi:SH3 domain-containing protein 19 isoform X1 [Pararge aegeria]|nr:SH3 domain-containing protein 19 isoform X1 [Pararge aegeria]
MEMLNHGMKGPTRAAPGVPGIAVNRYSPVTNWNDDPFGADVFEPTPQFGQKKKPPPRPPPPKVSKQPEVPAKPSHFIRRPTVLASLLSRKSKNTVNNPSATNQTFTDPGSEVDSNKIFPKCERVNLQMGTLIDLSSPPSSPTFTTRSSSDGVSVDSFGSDATTSTNHHNAFGGGNASQAESGFEDDFDLFLHSRKPLSKEDTLDDFSMVDPFSPPVCKLPVPKKPTFNNDLFDTLSNVSSHYAAAPLKGPTIIRAKPARPKPPDNSSLLKSTFGSNFQITSMSVNTTTPIQKISNGFTDNVDSKTFSWDDEESPERESTPPMPTIPPPPPPEIVDDDLPLVWPEDPEFELPDNSDDDEEPYAIALFDYFSNLPGDLCFNANSKIYLLRRENDEWMYGRLRRGLQEVEGLFPSNYVEIKVPLVNERPTHIGQAIALYDFEPVQSGDLRFSIGDKITVLSKINQEWYFGECNGSKGQFPVNYVQLS